MSTFEHKEGKGSLLINSFKKGDTQPDFKGSIKINGQTYQVAAWRKQTKAGAEMISLSVDQGWSGSPNMPRVSVPDPADDMPF
jgi:uncharacterized protein (DUF736 family)